MVLQSVLYQYINVKHYHMHEHLWILEHVTLWLLPMSWFRVGTLVHPVPTKAGGLLFHPAGFLTTHHVALLSTATSACTVAVKNFGQHQAALVHTEMRLLMANTEDMLVSFYTDCLESSRHSKLFAWIQSAPEYWTHLKPEEVWTLWVDCQEAFTKVADCLVCPMEAFMLEQERTRKLKKAT